MKVHGEITLSIPGELQYVWTLGVALKSLCIQVGMDESEAGLVELALVEAVNNSIIHAYRGMENQNIEVKLLLAQDKISIDIMDQGAERDKLPEPSLEFDAQDVNSLPEGGMGWYIINQVMDEVTHLYSQGRNHLYLTKLLAGPKKASGSSL